MIDECDCLCDEDECECDDGLEFYGPMTRSHDKLVGLAQEMMKFVPVDGVIIGFDLEPPLRPR